MQLYCQSVRNVEANDVLAAAYCTLFQIEPSYFSPITAYVNSLRSVPKKFADLGVTQLSDLYPFICNNAITCRGYGVCIQAVQTSDPEEALAAIKDSMERVPGMLNYLLVGLGRDNLFNAVIYSKEKALHDPSIGQQGIVAPLKGTEDADFFLILYPLSLITQSAINSESILVEERILDALNKRTPEAAKQAIMVELEYLRQLRTEQFEKYRYIIDGPEDQEATS